MLKFISILKLIKCSKHIKFGYCVIMRDKIKQTEYGFNLNRTSKSSLTRGAWCLTTC